MGSRIKTKEEHLKECESIAEDRGVYVLGVVEPFTGVKTKLILSCPAHGVWETSSINNFKNRKVSCPRCSYSARGENSSKIFKGKKNPLIGDRLRGKENIKRRKSDEEHIASFLSTGAFVEGTTFKRSDRKNYKGVSSYWDVTCPVCSKDLFAGNGLCSGVFEAFVGDLKAGRLPCRCSKSPRYTEEQWELRLRVACDEVGYTFVKWVSKNPLSTRAVFQYACPEHGIQKTDKTSFLTGKHCSLCGGHKQTNAYINQVLDEMGDLAVLKFGIANDSEKRLQAQNSRNAFQMVRIANFVFESVETCKAAERACKTQLECSVINKFQMVDGYTETTSLENYQKIVEIYESFGGKLQK